MERHTCYNLSDYNAFCTENAPYIEAGYIKQPPATFPCLIISRYHDNYNGPDWMELEIIERSDIPAPVTMNSLYEQPITA